MNRILVLTAVVLAAGALRLGGAEKTRFRTGGDGVIALAPPRTEGTLPVEKAIANRRSERKYSDQPLSLAEVGQLLWAAQGVTHGDGLRTAPSAGALYPLEVYLVVGRVTDLTAGVYKYNAAKHTLVRMLEGDLRLDLSAAALNQTCLAEAPAVIVFAGVYERTMKKYGERGRMYVHIEVGHAGQNVYLQAESLGLGTVAVGAFEPGRVGRLLKLASSEEALYLMPVGRR